MNALGHVAVLSLEPWDDIWRRNQHLASRLVVQGHASQLTFIEPPVPGRGRRHRPMPGVSVVRPALLIPNRVGGLGISAAQIRRLTRGADVLWVNAPELGARALTSGQRTVYDVTDDWRSYPFPPRILRRIVKAEDRLSSRASTIVCSPVLAERWQERYGIRTPVLPNGHDITDGGRRIDLPGDGPHVGYVGTVQAERLDLTLLQELSADGVVTVHLVGPQSLSAADAAMLDALPRVHRHPAVPAAVVADWLFSFDALICPHRIDEFTLSLDAIKAHEYLATGLPIVATPTSGFQDLRAPQARIVDREGFVEALRVMPAVGSSDVTSTWDRRTQEFARLLGEVGQEVGHP